MFKVTYLTQPQFDSDGLRNIGDRVIFQGVRNLMRLAIGPHEEVVQHLTDAEGLPDDTEIVVVCGMPQISQGRSVSCEVSRIAGVAQSSIPVKLNLGAGSFYFDAFGADLAKKDAAFAARVKDAPVAKTYADYAGFDLCTCRDLGAVAALRMLGVEALALPCPGFFSALFQPRPLFRRPEQLISVLNGTASFWNRVNADVHAFYRRLRDADPTRIFLAHDELDCVMLSELGIPHVTFDSPEQFLTYLAASERLLSLRVHGALPAWALGLDVTLLGIDRRALLGEDFGAQFRVIPVRDDRDLAMAGALPPPKATLQDDDFRRDWLRRHLDVYVRNIRDVIARKLRREIQSEWPLHSVDGAAPMQPSLSRAPGKYYNALFYSSERAFPVELKLLRSAHSIEVLQDGIQIETSATTNTLAFGPYVRVPKGRWKVTATIQVGRIPPGGELAGDKFSVTLRVMKGISGRELAAQEVAIPSGLDSAVLRFEVEFDNPHDTGSIETVFATPHRLPAGSRIRVSSVEMLRLE